jgi:hypothetical protein
LTSSDQLGRSMGIDCVPGFRPKLGRRRRVA